MTNSGDFAFASANEHFSQDGLTKRECFAAMAMQGIIASMDPGSADPATFKAVAIESVGYSEYLIAELNKPTL